MRFLKEKEVGNETLTSWLLRARKINKKIGHFSINENKLSEIRNLINSGLKTYEFIFYSLKDFLLNETQIKNHYLDFENKVVVRVVSRGNNLPRYTYIDKDYQFVKEQIGKIIPAEFLEEYEVVLNIYDPAKYCGVILSSPNRLIIEMVEDENLEKLCHGKINPWHAEFSFVKMHRFRTMFFQEPIPSSIKKKMWRIIKHISEINFTVSSELPNLKPRVGDFEFVISQKDNSLKFIDYKNEFWKML